MLGLTFKCHALLCAKLITFFLINNLIEEYEFGLGYHNLNSLFYLITIVAILLFILTSFLLSLLLFKLTKHSFSIFITPIIIFIFLFFYFSLTYNDFPSLQDFYNQTLLIIFIYILWVFFCKKLFLK